MSAEASTSAVPPKPIAPAETIPGGPKAALEGLAEPSVLDKVMETVKPVSLSPDSHAWLVA